MLSEMLFALTHTTVRVPVDYIKTCPSIFTYLLVFTVTVFLARLISYNRTLPPGPWGLPYLGCLPWMNHGTPHSWFLKLSAVYGDVFSLKLGNNIVVCLGSATLVRDLFNRSDSTGRPHTPLNNILGGRGIVLSEGLLWKKQRIFLHEKFRFLGVRMFSNANFEKYILTEVKELLQNLEASCGSSVDPVIYFGRHVHNVICQLMMSFRFEKDDPEFDRFNEQIAEGMRLYGAIHIGEHLPLYLRLPGKQATIEEIKRNNVSVSAFHAKQIELRRRKRSEATGSYEPADLLDCYLDVLDNDDQKPEQLKIFPGVDPAQQVIQVMNDLFSAGMETSRTSIVWSLVMMLREPDVAVKVREELRTVVEVGNLVTLEHRERLPYTESVIYETLRRAAVVPLGTTHVNQSTWNVDGYVIPAGSHIIPLINKINMDPALFPDPEKFDPRRFIVNGNVQIPQHFLPFGVGRRVCLGEQLAKMEMFLFFANIMNAFNFELPPGEAVPSLEGVLGITHAPHPYKLSFKKRTLTA